jgi:hypothetical protein
MKDIDSRLLDRLFIKEIVVDINEDPLELLVWDLYDLSDKRALSMGEIEREHQARTVYFGIDVFYTLQTDIKHFLDNYTSLENKEEGFKKIPCWTKTHGFIEISLFQKEQEGIPYEYLAFRLDLTESERFLGLINLLIEKHEENLKAKKGDNNGE